jgi:hypothetical protein
MSVHIHTMRGWCARTLVLAPVPLLLGWTFAPGSNDATLAQVSGRMTFADRPCGGMIYFLPEDKSGISAMGELEPDGSFQLYVNGSRGRGQRGALPGRYRVFFHPHVSAGTCSRADPRLGEPHNDGVFVHVRPGWNDVRIDLR